jgi:hypothetical protein
MCDYRDLAQEFRVGWNEYWPFLDTFTNLASQEGLQKLETYLKNRFQEAYQKPKHHDISNSDCQRYDSIKHAVNGQASGDNTVSPMSDLCLAFKACSLSDNNPDKPLVHNETKTTSNVYDYRDGDANASMEDEALLNVMMNPGLSPFLYVEKSCQVFAKRISDGLAVVGHSARISDSVPDVLQPEVRHLQDLVNSFKDDARFISVDFNLVHSRISEIVALKLTVLASDELEFVMSGLISAISPSSHSYSDDEDNESISYHNIRAYGDHQRKTDGERNQVRCIAERILSALEKEQSDKDTDKNNGAKKEIHVQTEEECVRIWSDIVKCSCFRQNQNFMRNTRKGSSFKRSHNVRYMSLKCKANAISSLDGVTRRLTFEGDDGEFVKSIYLYVC